MVMSPLSDIGRCSEQRFFTSLYHCQDHRPPCAPVLEELVEVCCCCRASWRRCPSTCTLCVRRRLPPRQGTVPRFFFTPKLQGQSSSCRASSRRHHPHGFCAASSSNFTHRAFFQDHLRVPSKEERSSVACLTGTPLPRRTDVDGPLSGSMDSADSEERQRR